MFFFIRTKKHNMGIFGAIPFLKLQNSLFVGVLFCSLIKGITPKIRMLCFVLIHCVLLNLLCVWIVSDTARRTTNSISLAV